MSKDEVRAASKAFYEALNRMLNGDAGSMAEVWSHDAATTMHPVGGRETGWAEVRETWERVAGASSDGRVELADSHLTVAGDAAWESGTERGRFSLGGNPVEVEVRVTNVYRRENGGWRIVHHHADRSPEMIAALEKLSAA